MEVTPPGTDAPPFHIHPRKMNSLFCRAGNREGLMESALSSNRVLDGTFQLANLSGFSCQFLPMCNRISRTEADIRLRQQSNLGRRSRS
jgi:hypothetical protein